MDFWSSLLYFVIGAVIGGIIGFFVARHYLQKQIKEVRTGLGIGPGVRVIPFSAETKQGREEIWELIEELAGREE